MGFLGRKDFFFFSRLLDQLEQERLGASAVSKELTIPRNAQGQSHRVTCTKSTEREQRHASACRKARD